MDLLHAILLVAVTGLRISEALALRFEDITAEGLVIRRTKFHKSRLVPLHLSPPRHIPTLPQAVIARSRKQPFAIAGRVM